MQQQQDIQLVKRLQARDLSAFDALYLRYYKLLCVSAYFFLKNEQEAKDLVQNLFLDIWDKELYTHFHTDLKGYLFRAVKNRCLNHIKKQKTISKLRQGYVHQQQEECEPFAGAAPDQYGQLYTALEDMPAQKKAAVQIVYLHGKKYREAAHVMGISINSLKTHLKTGLKVLRGEIKPGTD